MNCLSSTIIEIGSSELVIHICTYRFGDLFTRIVYRKKLEYPQHWRCCRTIYIHEDDCLLKPICQWIKKNHKMPIVFLWSRSKLLDLGSIINEAKDENVTMNGIFIELFFCLFNLELSFIKKSEPLKQTIFIRVRLCVVAFNKFSVFKKYRKHTYSIRSVYYSFKTFKNVCK